MSRRFTGPKGVLFFMLLASTALTACRTQRTVAVEQGWELIGEQKVNFVGDKDVITVRSPVPYMALRFRVEDHGIHINDLTVYFDNGDKLQPNIEEDISAGQLSRVVELGREGRYLDRVEFRYRTKGSILKGRANVLLFGERYYRGY